MDFQGKNDTHDALDEILRRYLLEHDDAAPDGDGLMELAASNVLSQPATITPSAAKEAEMVAKLQAQFTELPKPGPTSPGPALKYGLFSIGALAVLTTAFLLFFNPFQKNTPSVPTGLGKEYSLENGSQPLADDLSAPVTDDASEKLSSLQEGDGNAPILANQEELAGKGIQGKGSQRVRARWEPGPKIMINGPFTPDSRTGSLDVTPTTPSLTTDDYVGYVMDPFPLRSLYAMTSTQSNFYQIDPALDHVIVGAKGTLLHIPKGAFVDASSGETVTENVQVEMKEIYKRSDYINSNLPTVSNGQQLVSGGAIYLDATAAGRRLKLATGKDIYIEYTPQRNVETHDMQVYHGEYSDKGEMNLAPIGGRFKKMIPLDVEELFFEEFWCDCSGEKPWNLMLPQLVHEDFKNTWITTREFRQRMRVLRDMGYYENGFRIYLENTDKELWKVDQMVVDQLMEDAKGRKTKDDEVEYFHTFSQQMLTFTENFEDYGLDLTQGDARRQLMYRKVSREETERLIRIAKLRDRFAKEIESDLILGHNGKSKVFLGVKKGKFQKAGTELVAGYLLNQLGWNALNKQAIGEFASSKTREIKVRLTGNIPYESTRTFLAFTAFNSVLLGKPTTSQLYRFAKVPEGAEAWVVAIGFKNAMPYIGLLRLPKEGGDKTVQVAMEETRFDAYLQTLRDLD